MKGSFFIYLSFLLSANIFSQMNITLPEDGVWIDLTEAGGRLYLPMDLKTKGDILKSGAFLVDTGASKSGLLNSKVVGRTNQFLYDDLNSEFPPIIVETATAQGLIVNNWSLIQINSSLPESIIYLDKVYPVIGILGTEVLFKKSFYLDIAGKKMGWSSTLPFKATNSFELYPLIIQKNEAEESEYDLILSIPTDMKYTGHSPLWTGGKDGYIVDTGSYKIGTGYENFSKNLENIPNKPLVYSRNIENTNLLGTVVVPTFRMGDVFYENVYFSGGFLPNYTKVVGTQILSRFVWWFEISKDYIPLSGMIYKGRAYAKKISDSEYFGFNNRVDLKLAFIDKSTVGFDVDQIGTVNKIFYSDGKILIPNVSIGDRVITLNGIEFKNPNLGPLQAGRYGFRKPSGEEYFVDAVKIYLEGTPR